MRGDAIDLYPPTQGVVKNVPPHLVPRNAMIDGANVVVDLDGLLKPRFGYSPYLSTLPNIGPIIGVWWWTDTLGIQQYLFVSPTDVATVVNGAYVTITGATPLTGTVNDPVMFQNFFQNGQINVLIANNHDPIQIWNPNNATILPLTPTYALTGTNAYVGTTTPTFGTMPVNTQFFFNFQNANTGPVTIALNGLAAVPAKKLSNGVIVDFAAADLQPNIVYNFSFDGTELLLGTNLLAPVARDISVVGGRVVAINILNGNVRSPMQVAWTAAYDATVWPALAFNNLVDFDDPLINIQPIGDLSATIFGTQSGWTAQSVSGVTDPFAFNFLPIRGVSTGPCSVAANVVAEGMQYFMGGDGRIWRTDGSSVTAISDVIDPVVLNDFNTQIANQTIGTYYQQYRQIWWLWPSKSSNLTGPSNATVYDIDRGIFEPIQVFSEVIRSCYQEASSTGVTWLQLTAPWNAYNVSWNSFAAINQLAVFFGTDAGNVQVFSAASTTDNGMGINYFAVPSYIFADTRQDILIDSWDIYFNPSAVFELLTLEFDSLQFPFDTGTVLTATGFDLSASKSYAVPTSLPSLNTYTRYIRMKFSGISFSRAMAYGGGTIFVTKQKRASQEYRS